MSGEGTQRVIVVSTTVLFLYFQVQYLGSDDRLSLFLVLLTAFFMFFTVHKLHILARETWRIRFKKTSFIHDLLTGTSVLTYIVALVGSLVSAVIAIAVLKTLVNDYGYIGVFVPLFAAGYFIYSFLFGDTSSQLSGKHLNEDLHQYYTFLMKLIVAAFLLNMVVTTVVTTMENNEFLSNDTLVFDSNNTANEFEKRVISNAIAKNNQNDTSRIGLHTVWLMNAFKFGAINQALQAMDIDKKDYAVEVFIVLFVLNYIKLFGFSFAFVLLLKGVGKNLREGF